MKIKLLALLTLLPSLFSGCSHRGEPEPVVIHVLRDPAAVEIETAILAVGAKQLRSGRGQPVIVATIEPKDYGEGVEARGRDCRPGRGSVNAREDGQRTKGEVPSQSP